MSVLPAEGLNLVTAGQARNEPAFSFWGQPGKYYTVLMVDTFTASTNSPDMYYGEFGQYVHWAVANIPGEGAVTGIAGLGDAIPYQAPAGLITPHP